MSQAGGSGGEIRVSCAQPDSPPSEILRIHLSLGHTCSDLTPAASWCFAVPSSPCGSAHSCWGTRNKRNSNRLQSGETQRIKCPCICQLQPWGWATPIFNFNFILRKNCTQMCLFALRKNENISAGAKETDRPGHSLQLTFLFLLTLIRKIIKS